MIFSFCRTSNPWCWYGFQNRMYKEFCFNFFFVILLLFPPSVSVLCHLKFGGSNTAGGGVGCCCRYGCGWEKLGRNRGIISIYSLYCKNFMSYNLIFLMYINILCFSIIYVVYLLLHVTEKIRDVKKLIGKERCLQLRARR